MKCDPKTVAELARVAKGQVIGNPDIVVDGFAGVGEASSGDIVYAEKRRAMNTALDGVAACIVAREAPEQTDRTFIIVADPRLAFTRIVRFMTPKMLPEPGIHAMAAVADDFDVGVDVHIGAFAVVEADVTIGDNSYILAGTYIGRGCTIGEGSVIGPHAVLYPGVHVGDRVLVQAGTVLGSDGFGYVMDEQKSYVKIPQLGSVIVEDDVEIGSNVSVDRATLGETRIRKDSKVDNLVQIAHNVEIGEHTAISGQTGIAGSSKIGSYCILAGQVGIADHVTLPDRVIVGAQAGVAPGKRFRSDQIIWGSPAKTVDEWKRMLSALSRLAKRSKTKERPSRE